jgi:DNA topoisomerase-6 subunit B
VVSWLLQAFALQKRNLCRYAAGLPIRITSAQPKQKFCSQYVLDIDIERNEPNVHKVEKTPNTEEWHGAELSVIIEVGWGGTS